MHILENEFLSVKVKDKGAELCSLFNKRTGLEYIWQAGEAWPKHAPILFPFVGKLKNDTYYYNGQSYNLPQHGFARELDFKLILLENKKLVFTLESNADTLLKYPFEFKLDIIYSLSDDQLEVETRVTNISAKEMYFSIGFHPAFKIPLKENEKYNDYLLEFERAENIDRWSVENGLIGRAYNHVLNNENILPLSYELFKDDAIVLKGLRSQKIRIVNQLQNSGLEFFFNNFPFFGIWAKQNSDFVCLEPWQGIADSVNSTQNLTEKEGILYLAPNAVFICGYKVRSI